MGRLSDLRSVGERVFADVGEKNVTFMAAGLAYNAFLSLVPILLLVFLVLTLVGGGLEDRVIELANSYLPGPIAEIVAQSFEGDAGGGGASVLGIVVLLWGALKIFRGLDTAFSEIYETEDDNSLVDKLTDGFVVFVALVVAVLGTLGASAAFAVFADAIPYVGVLSPLVLVTGLVVAFLPMYYVFPDAELSVREVLPGAVLAAVGWAAFQGLFQVYLAFSDPGAGSFFGGVIILVTYLYASALLLLVGAVVNAVTGGHTAGHPGGIGRAAGDVEPKRAETLDRSEMAAYLRGLDERITARYEAATTDASGDDSEATPPLPPGGGVQLIEYASGEGENRRWVVELSWLVEADEQPPERVAGPADD
jgi:membrane protein